jgi:hypothetical protein
VTEHELRQMTFRPWPGGGVDSYGGKAVIELDSEPFFVELALVRLQEREGWEAVWVDNYRRAFRRGRADQAVLVELPAPQQAIFDAIAAKNAGGRNGTWDVFAWRGEGMRFLEAKRRARDRIRDSQIAWAAVAAHVVPQASFIIVEWDLAVAEGP